MASKEEPVGSRKEHVRPLEESNHQQLLLPELPDDLLGQIVSHLDFSTRLILRVNKRMEQRLLSFPNELVKISLKMSSDIYRMDVTSTPAEKLRKRIERRRKQFEREEDRANADLRAADLEMQLKKSETMDAEENIQLILRKVRAQEQARTASQSRNSVAVLRKEKRIMRSDDLSDTDSDDSEIEMSDLPGGSKQVPQGRKRRMPTSNKTNKKAQYAHMKTTSSAHKSVTKYTDFDALGKALNRWSINTHIMKIELILICITDEKIGRIVEAACNFKADRLFIHKGSYCDFPQLNFSTLLVIAQNTKRVIIDHKCVSIEPTDLCILQKNMLKKDSELESLTLLMKDPTSVAKACIGVTIQLGVKEASIMKTYKADESVELYTNRSDYPTNVILFEGELKTELYGNRITLQKLKSEQMKEDLLKTLHPIQLNHLYMHE